MKETWKLQNYNPHDKSKAAQFKKNSTVKGRKSIEALRKMKKESSRQILASRVDRQLLIWLSGSSVGANEL